MTIKMLISYLDPAREIARSNAAWKERAGSAFSHPAVSPPKPAAAIVTIKTNIINCLRLLLDLSQEASEGACLPCYLNGYSLCNCETNP